MIVPDAMAKVRIITPKRLAPEVIETLYRSRALHVKQYAKGEYAGLDAAAPLPQAEQLSQALLTLRATKAMLGIGAHGSGHLPGQPLTEVISAVTRLHGQAKKLLAAAGEAEQQLAQLTSLQATLDALARLKLNPALLPNIRHIRWHVGTASSLAPLRALKDAELRHTRLGSRQLIALFTFAAADAALAEAGFTRLDLQPYQHLSPKKLQKDITSARQRHALAARAVRGLKKHLTFLLAAESLLETEIRKAEIPLQFATTAQSLIASGYVPRRQLDALRRELSDTVQAVSIEEEPIGHDEAVPVKLSNPRPVRNFEVLTRLYELPNHLEFDPSLLLAFTFPLFFGFMLGDAGYGLVTLMLFLFIRKRFPAARQLMNVLVYASIVTIAFGFLFGEYFGFEHVSGETGASLCGSAGLCLNKEIIEHHGTKEIVYSFPRLLQRTHSTVSIAGHELLSVLFIGVLVGAVHLNLGLLIGFFNVWRAHGIRHALLEKLSWLLLQAGIALALLALIGRLALSVWPGALIAAAALLMIALGEGVKGLIEVPALFSNMLSYMRLGAVGLASVGLAVVVNENLAKPFLAKGGFFVLIAIIIMVIGHLINIGLGVLGPFLHGIRLHYVECFSKFFHGGGQEYDPFGARTPATQGGE